MVVSGKDSLVWIKLLSSLTQDQAEAVLAYASNQAETAIFHLEKYLHVQNLNVRYKFEVQAKPTSTDFLLAQQNKPTYLIDKQAAFDANCQVLAVWVIVPTVVDILPVSNAIHRGVSKSAINTKSYTNANTMTVDVDGNHSEAHNLILGYLAPVGCMVHIIVAPALIHHVLTIISAIEDDPQQQDGRVLQLREIHIRARELMLTCPAGLSRALLDDPMVRALLNEIEDAIDEYEALLKLASDNGQMEPEDAQAEIKTIRNHLRAFHWFANSRH